MARMRVIGLASIASTACLGGTIQWIARRRLRLCVLATALGILFALPEGAVAAVWTDQSSYTPGSIVTISGDNSDFAGYQPGEKVLVAVSEPEPSAPGLSCEATVESSGAWSCQVTLSSGESAIGEYSYTATGQTSAVSQSGSFMDSACPGVKTLGSYTKKEPGIKASFTTSGGQATYSFTSPNRNPNKGIPGMLEYCVYAEPQPDSTKASYSDWTAEKNTKYGYFNFERRGTRTDNVPFDGTTRTMGTATWNSGKVPAKQVVLCHINDPANSPAVSFVRCMQTASNPTATTTATPAFTHTYNWGISKTVDKNKVETYEGESAAFKYTVSVTHDGGMDGGWEVPGEISVNNPNKAAVTGINVTDAINDANANCTVTSGSGATLPAESVVKFPYSCTYSAAPEQSSETDTGTVKWPAQTLSDGSELTAGDTTPTASVGWSATTPTIVDGSAGISDTLAGPLGSVSYTEGPKEFAYEHTFSGDPTGVCTAHGNTATFTTNTSGTKGSAGQAVEVCVTRCHTLSGVGRYSPGQNVKDSLSSCIRVGSGESFVLIYENRTQHVHLVKLTSASATASGTEEKFSGHGTATLNKVAGYEISFSFTSVSATRKGRKWNFFLALEKGGVVVREFHDEPMSRGTKERFT